MLAENVEPIARDYWPRCARQQVWYTVSHIRAFQKKITERVTVNCISIAKKTRKKKSWSFIERTIEVTVSFSFSEGPKHVMFAYGEGP